MSTVQSLEAVYKTRANDGQASDPTNNMASLWTPTMDHMMFNQGNEEIYPDAAAGMDDWVFQGLDTAFFDNLMHDVGDSFLARVRLRRQARGSPFEMRCST
jgi:hypothetical protein